MPLYEFHCQTCQDNFELLVRSSDERLECPKCNSAKVERLMSVTAAPTVSGRRLPMSASAPAELCGRPQCNTGG